jgi:hypothetical protein
MRPPANHKATARALDFAFTEKEIKRPGVPGKYGSEPSRLVKELEIKRGEAYLLNA